MCFYRIVYRYPVIQRFKILDIRFLKMHCLTKHPTQLKSQYICSLQMVPREEQVHVHVLLWRQENSMAEWRSLFLSPRQTRNHEELSKLSQLFITPVLLFFNYLLWFAYLLKIFLQLVHWHCVGTEDFTAPNLTTSNPSKSSKGHFLGKIQHCMLETGTFTSSNGKKYRP